VVYLVLPTTTLIVSGINYLRGVPLVLSKAQVTAWLEQIAVSGLVGASAAFVFWLISTRIMKKMQGLLSKIKEAHAKLERGTEDLERDRLEVLQIIASAKA
jgi:hypothetical protein